VVSIATGARASGEALSTPASDQLADLATAFGDATAAVRTRIEAAAESDDEEQRRLVEEATEKFQRAMAKALPTAVTMAGVPIAPYVTDVRRVREAARGSPVDELLYRRRSLHGLPKGRLSHEQRRELAGLDGWYQAYLSLRQAEKAQRRAGNPKRAEELKRRLEDLSKRRVADRDERTARR